MIQKQHEIKTPGLNISKCRASTLIPYYCTDRYRDLEERNNQHILDIFQTCVFPLTSWQLKEYSHFCVEAAGFKVTVPKFCSRVL